MLETKKDNSDILLEFPKGTQKDTESNLNTALKALKEQTNLEANITLQLNDIISDTTVKSYLTEVETLDDLILKSEEGINGYKLVSLGELKELIATGNIKEGLTISTICKIICTNSDKEIAKRRL